MKAHGAASRWCIDPRPAGAIYMGARIGRFCGCCTPPMPMGSPCLGAKVALLTCALGIGRITKSA